MNDIFGIPMTTILVVTVAVMSLCLLTVAAIAWRNRVVFRMALRNIPRRKAQTVLITIGLMLSTLIIAASLTTGDTLSHSLTRSTYDALGEIDQTIAFVGDAGGEGAVSTENVPIPVSIVDQLETRFAGDPDIDSFMPMLTVGAPVDNPDSRLSEPSAVITGASRGLGLALARALAE
jgi:putative ABC transport system permease protein